MTDEKERRRIMDRLLVAEFGGLPCTRKPVTPPERWAEVLGERIDEDQLNVAAEYWREEPDNYYPSHLVPGWEEPPEGPVTSVMRRAPSRFKPLF